MEIVLAPDNRLRIKTKPVKKITPALLELIKQMVKLTKSFIDPEGVGLASTQIGKDEQYFIVKTKDNTFKPIFNPKILKYSKKKKLFFEGCLSIPDFYAEIERPISIDVTYTDKEGREVQEKLTGLEAWVFQHEYDHLQGKLFVDLVLEQKARMFKVIGKDRVGAEIFQEIKI